MKFICFLFSVLFFTPLATAEVFKCTGKNGETLYQNFPCHLESIGGSSEGETSARATPKSETSTDGTSVRAQGPKKSPALPAEPRVGMTTSEVITIWGEPANTVQEEPGNGPRTELWSYSGSRSVRFDRRGRVTNIQQ